MKLPNGQRVTDKEVARQVLRKITIRIEREVAGLIDPYADSAGTSIRTAFARYIKHIRRRELGRRHIEQVITCLKWLADKAGMKRLCDFNEDAIDKALGILSSGGRAPRTINVYRSRAHSFGDWAVTIARILPSNPVSRVPVRNESKDKRKVRRSLTIEQARRLIDVDEGRGLFYATALWTGLRVNEIRSLEWRDLRLEGERPCIMLRAETTKSGRADELPIHPDLVGQLVRHKERRIPFPGSRVFATVPILRTFKRDLERASIPFADAQGRTIDMHAMRTTFISWLGLHGVDPRSQVQLARHSPRGVTLRNYQDFTLFDLWAEIRKLPSIQPPGAEDRATGTGDEGVVGSVVGTCVIHRQNVSSIDTIASRNEKVESGVFSGRNRDFDPSRGMGDTGLEPVTSCVSSRRSSQLS